jgi:hypothetical protein
MDPILYAFVPKLLLLVDCFWGEGRCESRWPDRGGGKMWGDRVLLIGARQECRSSLALLRNSAIVGIDLDGFAKFAFELAWSGAHDDAVLDPVVAVP